MKPLLFSIVCLLILPLLNAQSFTASKRSLPGNAQTLRNTNTAAAVNQANLEKEIETKLVAVLQKYKRYPFDENTWSQVRFDATNILYPYFQQGRFAGIKPNEAFFVKIGKETMTSADIANKKMVLQVGIAKQKPAVFTLITVSN